MKQKQIESGLPEEPELAAAVAEALLMADFFQQVFAGNDAHTDAGLDDDLAYQLQPAFTQLPNMVGGIVTQVFNNDRTYRPY